MPIKLADFRLQSIFLEVRYGASFGLWDHAGQIATVLQVAFPELRLDEVKPGVQNFRLDRNTAAEVGLERTTIATHYPEANLDKFKAAADVLSDAILVGLRPVEFTRIGLRLFYEKVFASRDDAAKYLGSVHPVFSKEGKLFNVEGGRVLDGDIFLRWEGDALGCTVKILSQEKTLEVVAPPDFPDVSSISSKKRMVLVDIDYYAHGATPVAKFKASAVIDSWVKIIRRDVERFVNG